MRHDVQVVKQKNVWNACFASFTIILQIIEIETAYDDDAHKYQVGLRSCSVMKGLQSFFTLILLYRVYDYYQYQLTGVKKLWYVKLYEGKRPGPLPRGIWGSQFWSAFVFEVLICFIHVPPGLDFRYWDVPEGKINVNVGMKKPFLCDNFGVFMVMRLYMWVRVIRDYAGVYQRRRLIYEGGYRARGGPDINYVVCLKKHYLKKEAFSVFTMLATGSIILAYCVWVTERDYQPEVFTLKASIWFTVFQILMVGYNDMANLTQFGQWVALVIVFFGIAVLSLAIAVVFNAVSFTANESWAMDWLRDYQLKEAEEAAATDYLAHWWRYLSAKQDGNLPPDEARKKQNEHYTDSVRSFLKMSKTATELAGYADLGDNRALEEAIKSAKLVSALKKNLLGKTPEDTGSDDAGAVANITTLQQKCASISETQDRILKLLNEL